MYHFFQGRIRPGLCAIPILRDKAFFRLPSYSERSQATVDRAMRKTLIPGYQLETKQTQKEVVLMEPTKILSVGIDPAKMSHYAVAMVYPEVKLMSKKINNSYEAIAEFDQEVQLLGKERNLTVVYGLEDSGAYGSTLKEYLLEKERIILEINPLKTNRQKDFYGQDKSDTVDATCCASIVLRLKDKLPQITKENQIYAYIKEASRFRDTLVKNKTQVINRLHAQLTRVWSGVYKEFFPHIFSRQAVEFFINYPTPEYLKNVSSHKIASILSKASRHRTGSRKRAKSPQDKTTLILEKFSLVREKTISLEKEMQAEIIKQLALSLKQTIEAIDSIEKKLVKLIKLTGQNLTTLKGISIALSGVILGETLSPKRFSTADQFALFNGTAPRLDSTGGKIRHVSNKFCNRRLKRAFYQFALTSSRCDPISKVFYQAAIKRGLSKNEALKRLARRLSDIVFVMMKTKSIYDAQVALESMEHRRDSLLKQNEGKMANLEIRDIPLEHGILSEILEPCLTPKKNYTRGKTKIKENIPFSKERIFSDFASQKLALKGSRIKDHSLGIDKCIPDFVLSKSKR